jgi:hypothetical protein
MPRAKAKVTLRDGTRFRRTDAIGPTCCSCSVDLTQLGSSFFGSMIRTYEGLDSFDIGLVEERCCGFLERHRLLFRRRHDHGMSTEWDIQPAIAAD